MASVQQSPPASARGALLLTSSSSCTSSRQSLNNSSWFPCHSKRRKFPVNVRAEASSPARDPSGDNSGRRQALLFGGFAISGSLSYVNSASSEAKKGFQSVLDQKDGYTFLYPFGWQEVAVQGQDKVFKDVIEPLESVSVNLVPITRDDVKELGSPQEVVEALIKKVLTTPSQKTKIVEASERNVDGKIYYTFEFIAQAPNFTRHALGTISIGNGKFYTLTTGANERRWEKMKDRLHTVVDSFKIFNV